MIFGQQLPPPVPVQLTENTLKWPVVRGLLDVISRQLGYEVWYLGAWLVTVGYWSGAS